DLGALNEANTTNANNAIQAGINQANGICPDGSQIKTPGSVLHDALSKALGGDVDKLIGAGNTGEISGIFKNLANVMQTVAYGTALFGGASSGGLYGYGPTVNTASPRYLGATPLQFQQTQQQIQTNQQQAQANQQAQTQSLQQTLQQVNSQQTGTTGAQSTPTAGNPCDVSATPPAGFTCPDGELIGP